MRKSCTSTSFLRQIFSKNKWEGATHALSFNVHVNRLLGDRVYGLPNVFKKVNESNGVTGINKFKRKYLQTIKIENKNQFLGCDHIKLPMEIVNNRSFV